MNVLTNVMNWDPVAWMSVLMVSIESPPKSPQDLQTLRWHW